MATYELVFLADPRLTDEEVVALTDESKSLLSSLGATVAKEESWGKRKLAYQIQKLSEAYYVILTVETPEDVNPFPEVERRLEQSDKILRYMTVNLGKGRLRVRERQAPVAGMAAEPAAQPSQEATV